MNHAEFSAQMARLAARWKTVYVQELTKMIFREVESLPVKSFSRIVDDFVGSARNAPLVGEFREAARLEKELLWSQQKKQQTHDQTGTDRRCQFCNNTGAMIAIKRDDQQVCGFRCMCPAGEADGRNFPRFSAAYEKEFDSAGFQKYGGQIPAGIRAIDPEMLTRPMPGAEP